MIPEYKRSTNIGVGLGIVLQIAGRILAHDGGALRPLGGLVVLGGAVLFIWGCAQYAKGKGHSPWFGAFGLLSIIGLLVLYFLPDRHKLSPA